MSLTTIDSQQVWPSRILSTTPTSVTRGGGPRPELHGTVEVHLRFFALEITWSILEKPHLDSNPDQIAMKADTSNRPAKEITHSSPNTPPHPMRMIRIGLGIPHSWD